MTVGLKNKFSIICCGISSIPPNNEYVKALQQRWKRFAEHRDVRKCGIETVMGQRCYVVKHDRTRIFLAFKVDSRESYTGYRLNPDQSLNHDKIIPLEKIIKTKFLDSYAI